MSIEIKQLQEFIDNSIKDLRALGKNKNLTYDELNERYLSILERYFQKRKFIKTIGYEHFPRNKLLSELLILVQEKINSMKVCAIGNVDDCKTIKTDLVICFDRSGSMVDELRLNCGSCILKEILHIFGSNQMVNFFGPDNDTCEKTIEEAIYCYNYDNRKENHNFFNNYTSPDGIIHAIKKCKTPTTLEAVITADWSFDSFEATFGEPSVGEADGLGVRS